MISHNIKNKSCKSIFNIKNIIAFFFIGVLCLYSETLSNIFHIPSFSLSYDNVNDSNLTYQKSGIGLAINYCNMIKTYGDSVENTSEISYYPEVINWDTDSFTIYFVDTLQKRVSAQNIKILPNGKVITTFIPKLFNINPPQDCYFHIDKGECGFLASYVQKGSGYKRYFQLNNGTLSINVDSSISTGWLFSSQATMCKDTFLVINSIDMNRVILRKIYSCGNIININGTVKVADGSATPGNALMNCAVAADSEGTICTAVLKGSPTGGKSLYVSFFDRTFTLIKDTLFTSNICDNNYYYYDDFSITSIKNKKFAILFWDSDGIVLRTITINGTILNILENRIINKPGAKFCSLVSNRNYLAAIFKGDANSDGISCIEGIIYTIDNSGNLTNPQIFSFSSTSNSVIVDNFSTAINSAMDDSGSIAIVWRNGYKIAGSIWSYRCV
ncbi:MAG: hypothetical protein N2053_03030, partial [Chitinispirillaceae bacterium]|nr:hypothetical protein [Chitinispirillaceae bacterium]